VSEGHGETPVLNASERAWGRAGERAMPIAGNGLPVAWNALPDRSRIANGTG